MASPDLLFPLFGAIAVSALIFTLIYPIFGADKSAEKRMASVTENRQVKVASRSAADNAANRRKQVSDKLKELEDRQKQKEKINLRLRLQRAGLKMTPQAFWITSAVFGAVCVVTVVLSLESSLLTHVAAMVSGFVGMFGVPRWMLGKLTKKRQQKFLAEMANSLDVVVRGVKSGLPLNECLQIVARESPEPIASEFREVVEQQRVGIPLGEALERLADRMPLPEVRFLTIVIGIQAQAGGNLSEALGNLSEVLRSRIRMAMKVKALSAEATASAAVLASLPPGVMIMVYLSSPDYIMPLLTTKMGHFMIGVGLFWMGCGVLVMQKMINFKY
ncbi:MAG: type II secretion system F family protein [Alphaproteobacteria bacterium]|nr:type II secretion system F family protein [Alphaproteobacteria bacterium]